MFGAFAVGALHLQGPHDVGIHDAMICLIVECVSSVNGRQLNSIIAVIIRYGVMACAYHLHCRVLTYAVDYIIKIPPVSVVDFIVGVLYE